MKEVTKEVRYFQNFLNSSFCSIIPFLEVYNWDQYNIITYEWMRLNWQILVGGILLEKPNNLKPLDDRYVGFYDKDLVYNHAIVTYIEDSLFDIKTKKELPKNKPLLLDLFLSQKEGEFLGRPMGLLFSSEPPFDVAMLLSEQKNIYYTHFKDLRFYLVEWS